jgi:hypothetical protein
MEMKMEDPNSEQKEAIESIAYARAAKALVKMKAMEAAALLAVFARPGAEHKVLADAFKLTPKAITRATAKAVEQDLLMGKAGAWVTLLPGDDGSATDDDGDVRKHLADRLSKAESVLLKFNGSKYRSALERDVAVALAGYNVPYEREVRYSTLMTTDREWTADFVLKLKVETGVVVIIIEVTGRPDAQELLDEKLLAAKVAGLVTMVVREPVEIHGLVRRVFSLATAASVKAKADAPEEPRDPNAPFVTKGGVYINPLGVERRGSNRRPSAPPLTRQFANLPPLPPPEPIPGLNLRGWELEQLAELEKEEERLFIRERAEAARQAAQSEIDRSKLRETPEARVERALALLERDRSAMRARLEAKLTRTQHIEEFDKTYFEGEVELTGEECAEQDELPDDLEAGRGE